MKLSSALIAVTSATCPTGWSDGVATGTCIPDGVTISCSESTMTVVFGLNHVYEEGETVLTLHMILLLVHLLPYMISIHVQLPPTIPLMVI